MGKNYYYKIADLAIAIHLQHNAIEEENFLPFKAKPNENQYKVVFREVDSLPKLPEKEIYQGICYKVFSYNTYGFVRSFWDSSRGTVPYCVANYEWEKKKVTVEYLRQGRDNVSRMNNCFYHISWEKMMIQEQRLILHASCIDTPMGGLLFAGKSGIGKSTQASLWCKNENVKLINGDRPILRKKNNEWLAYGAPYAGSSKCYINENCKIKTILMLNQAKECSLRKLSAREAFKSVYSGLIINTWDREFVDKASKLAMILIEDIPIYEFCCTPDESAVKFLQKELEEVR